MSNKKTKSKLNAAAAASKAKKLLEDARGDGALSKSSAQTLSIVDLGAEIGDGLGVDVGDVESSQVVLVTMMPDDSGSIDSAGNVPLVIDGHNAVLEALSASRQAGDIFAHTRYLNGHVLCPFTPVEGATKMTTTNYDARFGTPLYDQAIVVLGTVIAKSQEFVNSGVPVRTITLLITDGQDVHSQRAGAAQVRELVEDMRAQENHIVAGMGLDNGSTDFRAVFREMGIEDRWILTPGSSASEIRSAFVMFSQSAAQLGSAAGATALAGNGIGGFVN